jgi:hypothetical protein
MAVSLWRDDDLIQIRTETSEARRPVSEAGRTHESIGETDVADGNAGEPDLYRTGRRDDRRVAGVAGLIVDDRRLW